MICMLLTIFRVTFFILYITGFSFLTYRLFESMLADTENYEPKPKYIIYICVYILIGVSFLFRIIF